MQTITDLNRENQAVFGAMFEMAAELVREMNLEESSYRLIINGGANQEIPILHIHLISDH